MTADQRPLRDVLEAIRTAHYCGTCEPVEASEIDAAVAAVLASAEIAALRERVAALERYVQHGEDCGWRRRSTFCTCGLSALLASEPQP